MMPYIPKMKDVLSNVLNLDKNDISIKAKTKEGLDSVGEKQAIETQVIVMLEKFEN